MYSRTRFGLVIALLVVLLGLSGFLGLAIGAVTMPLGEVYDQFVGGGSLLWRYRVPRVVVGMLAGAAMAVSGALLQVALRNPLAAPDTVGVTAGGGLAAVAALLGFGALPAQALTPIAFVGALLGALAVFALAGRGARDPIRLTLTGVAVSVGLAALTQLLLVRAAPEAGAAMTWLKGSLYARTLVDASVTGPVVIAVTLLVLVLSHHIDMLGLDSATMTGVGVAEARWRAVAVLCAIALGAAAVAAAGVLGFAGLIVPHAARLLVGPQALRCVPVAALGGAILVTACDAVGRWMFAPTEIPVGALIAIVGAPYFVSLVMRMQRKP
ncbi:FecCD family ABC transporter permease [Corynebacterium liangguodongii]|uniref:Iron ABC transporter permease n=1 Tax=Corynebacterium liangguodongii TaxID=2079535 RepID=A0A2S0WF86_9CORY|nr:iron ABC transporter permease [Corynebacterium liangguodongii]AWB84429.1 iron ABC transporter permease [Corynebacterium liangguodongii]PWB99919.1 iron ABC transporter permease [Corynebacterium liangguodongii]